MSTERDTHFQNAAHFLLQEMSRRGFIADDTSLYYEEMQALIAQHDYDLVEHALDYTTESNLSNFKDGTSYLEEFIPDLDAWPEPPTMVE